MGAKVSFRRDPEAPLSIQVINGGLNIPSRVDLSHTIITVEQGDINFNGSQHHLNNVVLIAQNGNINLGQTQAQDSAIFAKRTINMNGGARFSGDSLLANQQGNITFNGATATLSEQDWLQVISQGDITYNGASDTRGQFVAARNFTFNGRSTLVGSIEAKQNIFFNGRATVIGKPNQPPSLELPASLTVAEDETLSLSDVRVQDVDARLGELEVVLAVNQGQLNVANTEDLITFNQGERTLTLEGNLTALNTALAGLTYTPDANYNGSDTLNLTINDQGNTGVGGALSSSETLAITVTPVNDPPRLTVPQAQTVLEEEPLNLSGLTVSDLDAAEGELTVTLQVSNGKLDLDPSAALNLETPLNQPTLGFSGSLSALNQALETLTYRSNFNFGGEERLTLEVNDQGNSGAGEALRDTATVTITVIPVNEPPQAPADKTIVAEQDGTATPLDLVAPTDPDGDPLTLTVTAIPEQGQVQLPDGPPLSVEDPLTVEQLQQLAFLPLSGEMGPAGNFRYEVNDGQGGSDTQTIALEILPVVSLKEESFFTVTAEENIIIPDDPSRLRFTYTDLFFDSNDPAGINDAFEVALLDEEGNSLVHTLGENQDAFFNLTEGLSPALATGTTLEGETVTLDLSAVPATEATVVFRLVNNDNDTETAVKVRDLEVLPQSEASDLTRTPITAPEISTTPIDFDTLETVSASAQYQRTSFEEISNRLQVALGIQNDGGYELRNQLLMVVENLSATSVQVLEADGLTPSREPYFDFSHLLNDSLLAPQEVTQQRTISFFNPENLQFDYDLTFLSQLNRPPEFVSDPDLEVIAGQPYRYEAEAVDPDQDALTYRLQTGPEGLSVNAQTGEVIWTPEASEVGKTAVTLEVTDGRGGRDQQTYTLQIREDVPNRPPRFVSTPVVDAKITSPNKGGHIIVANDEWTLSNAGFASSPDDANLFVSNVAKFFTDNSSGSFLGYSDNFSFTGSSLANAFTQAGHQWTVTTSIDFEIDTLLQYDGVFIGGFAADNQVLVDYVNQGGNVYLAAGTASLGSAANEAQTWESFLKSFGLAYAPSYNGIQGNIPINASPHPIFAGVNELYQNNGNSIIDLNSTDNQSVIIASSASEQGLYALYDSEFALADANYRYDAKATDPDGDDLVYDLATAPEGMWIEPNTGIIRWSPTSEQIGSHSVMVEVTDGQGGVATQSYDIIISQEAGNRDPIITSDPLTRFNLPGKLNPPEGEVTPSRLDLDLELGETATETVSLTIPEQVTGDSFADVVFVVDESGSMGGEQAWIQEMVLDLDDALEAQGIGANRFGLIGYLASGRSISVGGKELGTAEEFAAAARSLRTRGGTEDGYNGMNLGFDYSFREGAAVNFILVTDEDRDVANGNLSFSSMLETFTTEEALLNAVVNANFRDENGQTALGVDSQSQAYLADGAGGFIASAGGTFVSDFGSTKQDYVDLAWAVEGAAWSLNQLRQGGDKATSFTEAFVDIKAQEIRQQLGIEVIASNPNVNFANLTGERSGFTGGETASFEVEIGSDGIARRFDLLFVRPDTNIVLGSIPVTLNNDYFYPVEAVDPDGDAITYYLSDAPAGATIDAATGQIAWEPNVAGEYDFTVLARDGRGGEDRQTYTVTVETGVSNQAPTINSAPPQEALFNQPFTYTVEASDPNEDFLSYYLDDAPTGMKIERTSGVIHWTPTSEQGGEQTVTVRILDGRGGETSQTFTLTVGADLENTAPEFVATPITTTEADSRYQYQALANDPDNDALSYDLSLAPEGMVIDENTGTLTWEPSSEQEKTHTVVVRVRDGRGGLDLQAFDLTVGTPNTAPVITSTPIGPAVTEQPYQYQVRAQDADGDEIRYRLDQAPAGMVIDETTGVVNWTPDQTGISNIQITAFDNQGGESQQLFSLEVVTIAPNTAPTITSTPKTTLALDQTYFYQLKVSDPNGDPLTYSAITAPEGLEIDDTGQVVWTPNSEQFGENEVTLQVSDGRGGIRQQSFTLNVVTTPPESQPPEITSAPDSLNATVGEEYRYDLTATDPNGDVVLWNLATAPVGMSLDLEQGTLRWTPTAEQVGVQDIVIEAIDSQGSLSGQSFTLSVRGTNLAPTLLSDPPTTASLDQTYRYTVVATDPEGDPITFQLQDAPTGMTLDSETGLIEWTPPTADEVSVTVEVSDALGATTVQTYSLAVTETAANQAPAITSTPINLAATGEDYQYQVTATDPEDDPISFQLQEGPPNMTLDSDTGVLTWQPPEAGTYTIAVGAVDPSGLGGGQRFSLTVADNQSPVITSSPVTRATPEQPYRYDLQVSDPEGDPLDYELLEAPAGMTVDSLGRVRWLPLTEASGPVPVTIAVRDGRGGAVSQEYTLEVFVDEVAPTVTVVPSIKPVALGEAVTLITSATDNVGVERLTLTVNDRPVPLDANGLYTFTPDEVGDIEVQAQATDQAGNVSQAQTTFSVLDFSDTTAPVIELASLFEESFTAPTEIVGTVNDDNLVSYSLSVAPLGSDDFQVLFEGTEPVVDGGLGTFDPTLLANEAYTLRLSAEDAGGNQVSVEETVNVAGDLKLGNFQLSFTDLEVPVSGIPITVTRTYDTLTANTQDDFGYGWRLEYRDTNLTTSARPTQKSELYEALGVDSPAPFDEQTRVYITLPGGERESFRFEPKLDFVGSYLAAAGASAGLEGDTGLYLPTFAAEGDTESTLEVEEHRILRGTDNNFYGLNTGAYNPANTTYGFGGYYKLTTAEGIEYHIDAKTGDLETVTDRNGNVVTFSEGGIKSDSGVEITFGRDASGRITTVSDPEGNEMGYEYDADGDLIAVTDREGNTTQFEYSDQKAHYLDEVIDPLGRSGVRTEYNQQGRLERVLDVNGEAVNLTYDTDNSVQTVADELGNETTYVYDERGNVLSEVDPVGKVTERTYDEENNLLSETIITSESGEEGDTTTFTYDEQGNQTSRTDPLGNTERYTYNQYNQLLASTDALGNTTRYTYDNRGNVLSKTDATGNTIRYTYDSQGNPLSIIEGENDITTFEYDSRGNKIKETDALGNVTTYTHDAQGNVLTETTTLTTPEGTRTLVTTKTYDSEGNETSVLDAEGNLTQYEYDANGNRTAIIDPLGRKTINRYDQENNLIATIYPDDTPQDLSDNLSIQTEYDTAGNRIAVTNVNGSTTRYTYDPLNRPTGLIIPDDTPQDPSDNPRLRVEYNQAGQMTALTNELGNRTEYEYDAAGRIILTRQFIEGEAVESTTTYDAAGQTIAQTDALGRTTRYVYDELGQVIATYFPDGTHTETSYDAFGNEIAKIDQTGNVTRFEYDALDQLTAVENALGYRSEYQYDEAGNLVYQEDANGHVTRFEFDGLGQQTATIRPGGQESLTVYDAVGNPIRTTDFNGETILYEYNETNQLTQKEFADGSTVELSYEKGQLTQVIDERGTTQYDYNQFGQLLSRTEPDGTAINYTYTDAGQVETIITPAQTIAYTYDDFNRLDEVTANGETTDYNYNVVGNLVKTILPNGVVETRDYDQLNRLIELVNTNAEGTILSHYDYTLDAVGNRVLVEELGGRRVSYEYDALSRLISEEIIDADNETRRLDYSYDAVGNRLTLTDSVEGVTTYIYNDNDWLLEETTAGITTEYTYDANGNLLSQISPSEEVFYEWNPENRLVGVETTTAEGTSNIEYQYNVDGIRVASIVDGVETRYLVDTSGQYTQVLEEYRPDGTTDVAYVYGNDLISQQRGEEMAYYLYDGHSGVRQLSDEGGAVTDTYVYDAYGNLLSATGETENNYLYRGEQFDSNVGLQYLRARYYDPSSGRFVSVDPFAGIIEEPMSRHRYLYGYDNPVSNVDPSGMFTLADVAAGNAIQDILAASAIGIGAVGIIGNTISNTITQQGAPWEWNGKLWFGVLGGLANPFIFSTAIVPPSAGFARLTSECYPVSSGSYLEAYGNFFIYTPVVIGAGLFFSFTESDVIVQDFSGEVRPSIYDLTGVYSFIGGGSTLLDLTAVGTFAFRMQDGIGFEDPNGTTVGIDVSLGFAALGISIPLNPVYNIRPCTQTP